MNTDNTNNKESIAGNAGKQLTRTSNFGGKCSIIRDGYLIASEVPDKDADFIVTACNNHHALVEVLKNAVGYIKGESIFCSIPKIEELLKQITE